MFVSEFFQLDEAQREKMHSWGVFDALLDVDSNFFLNIIRLKESTIPEFQEAYQRLNEYFSDIATLLDAADAPNRKDVMFRSARSKINFHEVNGINLGFSKSGHGSGWGNEISNNFLADAYQIVKKGSKQPEIFHLASLFEEGVGPDLLSDMIASIIKPQIKKYTLRVMAELGITRDKYSQRQFYNSGLAYNPMKKTAILLLPTEILHKLPIARDWNDIDRVVFENECIRREISREIGEQWTKWASADKKHYLKNHIFMDPDVCSRVIEGYRNKTLDRYDPKEDTEYLAQCLLSSIKQTGAFNQTHKYPSSIEGARAIINIFKEWVENNRGWAIIQDAPTQKLEKAVQRFMHLGAKYYVEKNDLDISCEADEGRGPVDIKLSRGTDKTVAEIKLSSNSQYLHGFETQIREYGLAERTRNLIYVFVDIGNPGRRQKIKSLHDEVLQSGKPCPELIIIDAQPKKAASTFESAIQTISLEEITNYDMTDIPEINFDEIVFPNIDDLSNEDFDDLDREG